MINRLIGSIEFSANQIEYLDSLKPYCSGYWDIQTHQMKDVKNKINSDLNVIQENNKCAYCGLELNETCGPEIDHIAPKGKKRDGTILYPQFMFEPKNLALACHRCNFENKKIYDSIQTFNDNYAECSFKIVHPYFDDPLQHLDWVDNRTKILIIGLSDKGRETIKLFKLDEEQQSTARAKLKIYERFYDEQKQLIKDILNFTGKN
jgi:uncharacterized protein (TIGR02646 family)